MARDFTLEGQELERLLRSEGILTPLSESWSLTDLVKRYVKGSATGYDVTVRYAVAMDDTLDNSYVAGPFPNVEIALGMIPLDGLSVVRIEGAAVIPMYRAVNDDWVAITLLAAEQEELAEVAVLTPNEQQQEALTRLKAWLADPDERFFTLKGYAGTGKTFLMRLFADMCPNLFPSAPTNKAAKVLGTSIGRITKTTYSLLGLRLEEVEDRQVLTQSGNIPYFPRNSVLLVDEAGMVGSVLLDAIVEVAERYNLKVLFVGDPAQLNPVKERKSKAWSYGTCKKNRITLTRVMRNDNQLLTVATALRSCMKEKNWWSPIKSDHGAETGVWKWKSKSAFSRKLLEGATIDTFIDSKVIAWRNKTVDYYNSLIRDHLGFTDKFHVTERILLAEPIEEDGSIIAHTDDEFTVNSVSTVVRTVDDDEVECWQLVATGDQSLVLDIPKDLDQVKRLLSSKASLAHACRGQERKERWRDFWETKRMFHNVRYAYAMTAHRAQGSTYTNIWLDQMDILANPNKLEAFRCLYVGSTRPTTNLHSY